VIGAFWGKRGAQQARQLEGARNNAPRLVPGEGFASAEPVARRAAV
jgi:hypothetical protein